MKYYGKHSLASVLKVVMDILLIVAPIVFLFVFITSIKNAEGNYINLKNIITTLLYIIGGSSLLAILFNLRNIVASLIHNNPFIIKNVHRLENIAVSCFLVSVCYVINFFVNQQFKDFKFIFIDSSGIHTDIEFLIFFFTGCFILILSKVFKQAVEFKEEHDFTI
ncbi:DUF2975 domain-containing protein [Clostridium thermarum]|uniref:DUF2975 domain-containing protein n=1 Tax=Clostridium thermarum TaxID=1716543 RepID=UPI001124B046|nr:DUF2975 domain-containing protein [Clostridium thermarum]